MEKFLKLFIHYSLFIILFLFPLFFLPATQEFFVTNKLYLISFGALLSVLVSCLQLLVSKKIVWQSRPLDRLIVLFLLTVGLSTVIASPNKVQAIFNPNFGLLALLGLGVLYYYLSRQPQTTYFYVFLRISTVFLSLITIIFFFQPFKSVNLPGYLQFLKTAGFTPLGSPLDLGIWLGFFVVFFVVYGIMSFPRKRESSALFSGSPTRSGMTRAVIIHYSSFIILVLALLFTLYSLLKPASNLEPRTANLLLPPFHLSWYAAVEILKNPLTALFGVGVDNFSSIFTAVKDLAFNQSTAWQIAAFTSSRSTLLHIFTETGIFGLAAFGLLLFTLLKLTMEQWKSGNKLSLFLILYLLFFILFFPPSFPVWFLFFLLMAWVTDGVRNTVSSEFDLSQLLPVYLGTLVVSFLFIAGSVYFLGRSYAAEYFFKKSLDGFAKNDAKQVYDNMRQAIIFNPYIERFRLNFSQVNLLLANNIAGRGKDLTDQDRTTITQAIQAAISEAKAAVALNPQKAGNWENLAVIYRNIINTAQGADVWTVSAYQRAIVADPQNPIYRLNLGGVYYSLVNYDEAVKLFEQAVSLKPDWPNAHYNLAWADFQRAAYQRAVAEMQNVLTLLNPQKDKADYERAQKDLEEFKKKLPAEEKAATPSGQPQKLTLPTPPAATLEPKIKLPSEASPEAK